MLTRIYPRSAALTGAYEWFKTYRGLDVPRVVALLGGAVGDNILDLLAERWTGAQSYALEKLLRDSDVPVKIHLV